MNDILHSLGTDHTAVSGIQLNGGIKMNIVIYIYLVLCGGLGIISSAYLTVSMVVVIIQKIFGKVRYGKSLYD